MSFMWTGTGAIGGTGDLGPGIAIINGNSTTIVLPGTEATNYDIWTLTGVMIILYAIIAVGAIVGIHFLGTGLGETSQEIIFKAAGYLGLYGVLSVISGNIIWNGGQINTVLWMILTILFTLGFITDIRSGSTEV
jgi:hypothetical protein